ncbi:hypothetical protein N752_22270 [Desulforamulus aquiferis]|nr:hypothetical protein N752_22270 [Desulforamulus aquiferis]
MDDGPTAPAEVKLASVTDNRALLEITIHEGRNRQVRRMCEHIGYQVLRLQRTRVGPLNLEGLKPGQFRPLTQKELREIFLLAGIKLSSREEELKGASRTVKLSLVTRKYLNDQPNRKSTNAGALRGKGNHRNSLAEKDKTETRKDKPGGLRGKRNDRKKFSKKIKQKLFLAK